METIRARAGAALLDLIRPDWATEINVLRLDLSDCEACILGQLYGKYYTGAEKLFAVAKTGKDSCGFPTDRAWTDSGIEATATRAGFISDSKVRDFDYNKLTTAWRREIQRRLPKVEASKPLTRKAWVAVTTCEGCKTTPCKYDMPVDVQGYPIPFPG